MMDVLYSLFLRFPSVLDSEIPKYSFVVYCLIFPAPTKIILISLKPKTPLPEVTHTKPISFELINKNYKCRIENCSMPFLEQELLTYILVFETFFHKNCKQNDLIITNLWYCHSIALNCVMGHYVHNH